MRPLLSPDQMYALERGYFDTGALSLPLMERAAQALIEAFEARFGPLEGRRVAVACGAGNNGGDGWAFARLAAEKGARVTIRGWRDALNAVEAEVAKKLPGRAATSAEVVQMSLKKNGLFVEDSVKIVAQRDVKDCLSEFVISMTFAPEPSLAGDEQPAAGGKKKKGGR